jgi:hypothetical protein
MRAASTEPQHPRRDVPLFAKTKDDAKSMAQLSELVEGHKAYGYSIRADVPFISCNCLLAPYKANEVSNQQAEAAAPVLAPALR